MPPASHSSPASSCSLIALVGMNYISDAVNGARFAARPEAASVAGVLYLSPPGLQPGWQDPQGGTVRQQHGDTAPLPLAAAGGIWGAGASWGWGAERPLCLGTGCEGMEL